MQTDMPIEPLHQRILVPLGASIALAAAAIAAAAIALIATPAPELAEAMQDGTALDVLHAIVTVIVETFWWLVSKF